MIKSQIRQQMKQKLSAMDKHIYHEKSDKIAGKLFEELSWKQADTIGITISNPPEVDTYKIIEKAWELGKTVAVPKCHPARKQMTFRVLENFSQLEKVFFNLYEPTEALTKEMPKNGIELLFVPGLAFSKDGYRIGFGGGYYDRYLIDFQGQCLTLAFDMQIVKAVPVEDHDLPVSKIITDKKVLNIHD